MEIDYQAVLNDLYEKRTAIDEAIRGITAIMKLSGITPPPAPDSARAGAQALAGAVGSDGEQQPTALESDAFFGMSIVEATKKYLGMTKRPKSTNEIKDALEAGGYNHTSKNFYSTIFSVLSREAGKPTGEIVKVNDKWGLESWYPNRRRETSGRRTTRAPEVESADAEFVDIDMDDVVEPSGMSVVKVS